MANTSNGGSGALLKSTASDMRALAEYGAEQSKPEIQSISRGSFQSAAVIVVPEGKRVMSMKPFLDEYQTAPERKKGTAELTTLISLVEHINRFKDEQSAVFALDDRSKPAITAVLDYHHAGTGTPRFGHHRAHYAFPLSDEWKAWQQFNAKPMTQTDFAVFMEDRIADVLPPPGDLDHLDASQITERESGGDFGDRSPDEQLAYLTKLLGGKFAGPATMMELSRGLSVHADEKVAQAVSLASGESFVSYVSEHKDGNGAKVNVPNLFLIGIPVFRHDARYRIAVRLRYRVKEGAIFWIYELYRHDAVFDDAFRKACEKVKNETALPLFYGAPE